MRSRGVRKFCILVVALVIMSLFTSTTVSARGLMDNTTAAISVSWTSYTHMGIKIVFPTSISGNFAGTLGASHFDCAVVDSNTLYCIGPYSSGNTLGLLTIYQNTPPYNIFLTQVITIPPRPGQPSAPPPPVPLL